MSLTVKALVYKQNGLPEKVISLVQSTISTKTLGQSQVLVRWLAAPINPLDFAKIMGVIKEQPPLPAIGGTEGCGVVEKIGSGVTTLQTGDLVIPAEFGVGTWRTHGIHESKQLTALGKSFSKFSAAMLLINPPTAYRLLKDFVELKQGDVVAQNGANSACGRYIIQFCRIWGYKTVNVIRDRSGVENLKNELKALGADDVYTEEEFAKVAASLKGVKLAIDCVGREKTLPFLAALEPEGTMVIYGGMSFQPAQVDAMSMISKTVHIRGFNIMKWYWKNPKESTSMFCEMEKLLSEGKLKDPPITERKIEDFGEAILAARASAGLKQMFIY